jgi:hypothetical protein
VLEKVDSFRDFVVSYVKQQGLWSQAVEVVAMSAMNSYLYRLFLCTFNCFFECKYTEPFKFMSLLSCVHICIRAFLSTSSFTLMANKEVIRLCGMELGGQGKELAKGTSG